MISFLCSFISFHRCMIAGAAFDSCCHQCCCCCWGWGWFQVALTRPIPRKCYHRWGSSVVWPRWWSLWSLGAHWTSILQLVRRRSWLRSHDSSYRMLRTARGMIRSCIDCCLHTVHGVISDHINAARDMIRLSANRCTRDDATVCRLQ